MPTQKADFAAGCFWGVEETFRRVPGVVATAAGYEGGTLANPTYEDVCYKETGHAETVQVEYDPAQVSYAELLKIFWANHDATTPLRQGDGGGQYRSAIFTHTPEQEAIATAAKAELNVSRNPRRPLVTVITPATRFWRAEDYHQQYFAKRGNRTSAVGSVL